MANYEHENNVRCSAPSIPNVSPEEIRKALGRLSEVDGLTITQAAVASDTQQNLLVAKPHNMKLHFDLKLKVIKGSFFLFNDRGNGPVAFKVKTNNARRIVSRTRAGVLLEGEVMEVKVGALMHTENAKSGRDVLLVEQCKVPLSLSGEPFLHPDTPVNDISKFFKSDDATDIRTCKVPVEYDNPVAVVSGPRAAMEATIAGWRGRQRWRSVAVWLSAAIRMGCLSQVHKLVAHEPETKGRKQNVVLRLAIGVLAVGLSSLMAWKADDQVKSGFYQVPPQALATPGGAVLGSTASFISRGYLSGACTNYASYA